MKNKLLLSVTAISLLCFPKVNFAQAPPLGAAADFILFTTVGEVKNVGATFLTHLTGNVGSNSNSTSPGFGNVDGVMTFTTEAKSIQCAGDLQLAYNSLFTPKALTNYPSSPVLGNGQILIPGVYSITDPSISLNLELILDGQGNPNAVFIFQLNGAFSTNTNARVKLINKAQACNVYWGVFGGAVSMGTGSAMRGTIITDKAIFIAAGDTLEGRALTINGAVTVNSLLGYTPLGCAPVLTGPTAPTLGATACYGLFSATGGVSNTGTTFVTGDVGSNSTAPTGFNAANVTGTIHAPDGSTSQCATDLLDAYTYISTMSTDIELLSPVELGMNLVLTPHTYYMNAAATLTDTLFLNAQGNPNAVFVLKINGAFNTTSGSKVRLINGAQSKNVYWMSEGEANLGGSSTFCGTLISHTGAVGALATGVKIDGRALTTGGALTTSAMNVVATMIPGNCISVGITPLETKNETITIYPNPFSTSATIILNNLSQIKNCELIMYNVLGAEVMNTSITEKITTLKTNHLPTGIYFYKITGDNKTIQSGKLISQQ